MTFGELRKRIAELAHVPDDATVSVYHPALPPSVEVRGIQVTDDGSGGRNPPDVMIETR